MPALDHYMSSTLLRILTHIAPALHHPDNNTTLKFLVFEKIQFFQGLTNPYLARLPTSLSSAVFTWIKILHHFSQKALRFQPIRIINMSNNFGIEGREHTASKIVILLQHHNRFVCRFLRIGTRFYFHI